jgi:hypothetical protein
MAHGGSFVSKQYIDNFTSLEDSLFTLDSGLGNFANHTYSWTGTTLKSTPTSALATAGRLTPSTIGKIKHVDVTFKIKFFNSLNPSGGDCLVMLNLRQDANNDGTGYLLIFKRTSLNTIFVDLRKGAGVTPSGSMSYGTNIVNTVAQPYTDYMNIRVKLSTNGSNLPELKLWMNNIADTDTPITWGTTPIAWVDSANTYNSPGNVILSYVRTTAKGALEFDYFSATTTDVKQYVRDVNTEVRYETLL